MIPSWALPGLDEFSKVLNLRNLAEMDDDSFIQTVYPKLWYIEKDPRWLWRCNILRAMANSKNKDYLQYIQAALKDSNESLRGMATWAHERLGSPRITNDISDDPKMTDRSNSNEICAQQVEGRSKQHGILEVDPQVDTPCHYFLIFSSKLLDSCQAEAIQQQLSSQRGMALIPRERWPEYVRRGSNPF